MRSGGRFLQTFIDQKLANSNSIARYSSLFFCDVQISKSTSKPAGV